ncbi:MAG: hypothetical protein KF901_02400 [Myxococcales bacterium]|nr:hypothetical protein [Myxococcales bacterium]
MASERKSRLVPGLLRCGIFIACFVGLQVSAQDEPPAAPPSAVEPSEHDVEHDVEDTLADDDLQGEDDETRDSDDDGIPDAIEIATGTSPLRADTDRDGVPDGVEDANQDGIVDAGESDPRRPGLFPGGAPHIPEPMNFDLVRGLGARRGEVEANVLVQVRPRRGRFGATTWAPEVEWAFWDGLAIEIELPMVDREVEALKAAFQWTAPSRAERFTHGVQAIVEYLLDADATELTALYLAGGRIGHFALFAMAGARVLVGGETRREELLLNPSVYYDINEAFTIGLEGNIAWAVQNHWEGLALAQLHWQIVRRFRLQIGAGAEWQEGQAGALVVSRLILE